MLYSAKYMYLLIKDSKLLRKDGWIRRKLVILF